MFERESRQRSAHWGIIWTVGRSVDIDDLVGTKEIAERIGVSQHQVVHQWRRRYPDFPAPLKKVSSAFVWDWNEVEAWARRTGRILGDANRT